MTVDRRRIGRPKVKQDVSGADNAGGCPDTEKVMACDRDAVGHGDSGRADPGADRIGLWMAGTQAGTVFAIEERPEENAGAGGHISDASRWPGRNSAAALAVWRDYWTGVSFGHTAARSRNERATDYCLSTGKG